MTRTRSSDRIATDMVVGLGVSFAFFSIGLGSPIPVSVTEVFVVIACVLTLVVYQRIKADDVSLLLAAVAAVALISALLNIGNSALSEAARSIARLAFWLVAFQILQLPLSRADYATVSRRLLNFAVVLAVVHLLQLGQALIGQTPLSLPGELFYRGEPRWYNPVSGWRPGAVFSEVSWYGVYQCTILALTLLWSDRRDRAERYQAAKVSLVAISVLVSRSLAGEILLIALLALWGWRVLRRGRFRARGVLPVVLFFVLPAVLVWNAGVGEYVLRRLTLQIAAGSMAERVIEPVIWARSALATSPVVGIGLGNEVTAVGGVILTDVEIKLVSAPVYLLGTLGLLGLSVLLLLLVRVARKNGGGSSGGNIAWFGVLALSHGDALLPAFWVPLMLWYGAMCHARDQRLPARSAPQLVA